MLPAYSTAPQCNHFLVTMEDPKVVLKLRLLRPCKFFISAVALATLHFQVRGPVPKKLHGLGFSMPLLVWLSSAKQVRAYY